MSDYLDLHEGRELRGTTENRPRLVWLHPKEIAAKFAWLVDERAPYPARVMVKDHAWRFSFAEIQGNLLFTSGSDGYEDPWSDSNLYLPLELEWKI